MDRHLEEIGRRYIVDSDYDVRAEATLVIERFGDQSDAQVLIDVAKKSEGVLQVRAARGALTLSKERQVVSVARQLLDPAQPTLVSVTIEFLLNNKDHEISDFLRSYLASEDENIRGKVLVCYAKNYSKDELEEVLETYKGEPGYYYNVVCWLDRIVYAPSPLKELFVRELESKLWIDLGAFGKSEAFETFVRSSSV